MWERQGQQIFSGAGDECAGDRCIGEDVSGSIKIYWTTSGMYASFKYGTTEERRLGRFFSDYRLDELEQIFLNDSMYELVEKFETEDVRPDYKDKPWVNIIVGEK